MSVVFITHRSAFSLPRSLQLQSPGVMDGELTLWGGTGFRTWRVVWCLEELGLPFAHHPISSRDGSTQTVWCRSACCHLGFYNKTTYNLLHVSNSLRPVFVDLLD